MEQCDPRARETVSIDGHVGCVFERQVLGQGLGGCRRWGGWGGWGDMLAVGTAVDPAALTRARCALPHCRSPYCHAVVRGHVCAVFAGEIAGVAMAASAAPGLHAQCQPKALHASQAAAHRALCSPPIQPGRGTTRLQSTTTRLSAASRCLWRTMPPGWCRWGAVLGVAAGWAWAAGKAQLRVRAASPATSCTQVVVTTPPHLQFYDSFSGHASMDDVTEAALRALSRVQVSPQPCAQLLCLHACYPCSWAPFQPFRRGPALLPLNLPLLQGSFAFVLFDSLTKRVWAARDAEGVQPLFWGVTGERRLEFGSQLACLGGSRPAFWAACFSLWVQQLTAPAVRFSDDNRLVFGTHPDKLDGEADRKGWGMRTVLTRGV